MSELITLKPQDIISAKRFDIPIKTLYLRSLEKSLTVSIFQDMYKEHLRIWNGFKEPDNDLKNSFEKFDEEFKLIADDIKHDRFNWLKSPIPYIDDYKIVNGAHRFASSIVFNKNVTLLKGEHSMGCRTASYERLFLRMQKQHCQLAAIEYAKLSKRAKIVTLFSSNNGHYQRALEILQDEAEVCYISTVDINAKGYVNLMQQFYHRENWANSENDWSGLRWKANKCYSESGITIIALVDFRAMEHMTNVKQQIRDLYNIEKHSVHINDTHDDTVDLAKLLFNDKSIDFLNKSSICQDTHFLELCTEFKFSVRHEGQDVDDFAISGSGPMAMYGLRKAKDLDYIEYQNYKFASLYKEISSHNNYAEHFFSKTLHQLIYEPDNHFYAFGLKFVSLENILQFKQTRNEIPKDTQDIELLLNIL